MSNPLTPSAPVKPMPAKATGNGLSTAEVNAAAASFAGLTGRLDYLNVEDLASVRRAYRFADEAHLCLLYTSRCV